MLLQLHRDGENNLCTFGTLSVNGHVFCRTLEPPPTRYRIPTGTYDVDRDYPSAKFRGFRPLIKVRDGHTGILIHEGNTAADTLGCILVGSRYESGRVVNSRDTLRRLLLLLQSSVDAIKITVE